MSSKVFQPKNKEMFNRGGSGPSIYNGYGTTKTPPAPTLFVTNIPAGATAAEVDKLFRDEEGFQGVRTVRHMIFVDFYDTRSATDAMRRHQNTFLEGFDVAQGLMVDFDKDPRHKRNKAFTASRDRGAFSHGFSGGLHMAAVPSSPHRPDKGGRDPRKDDPTLELIEEIKRKHREEQGVPVPLHAGEEGLVTRKRARLGMPDARCREEARKEESEKASFALPGPKQSLVSEESLTVHGRLVRKHRPSPRTTSADSTGDATNLPPVVEQQPRATTTTAGGSTHGAETTTLSPPTGEEEEEEEAKVGPSALAGLIEAYGSSSDDDRT